MFQIQNVAQKSWYKLKVVKNFLQEKRTALLFVG